MSAPKMPELRDITIRHAAYNIAWGLQRMLSYADEPGQERAREGAEMLREGLREALEMATAPPDPAQEGR